MLLIIAVDEILSKIIEENAKKITILKKGRLWPTYSMGMKDQLEVTWLLAWPWPPAAVIQSYSNEVKQ